MSEPLTVAQLKNKVDQDVTIKVTRKSITPLILGNLLKTIIDFFAALLNQSPSTGNGGAATFDMEAIDLTNDDLGKLVANVNGKAKVFDFHGKTQSQKGRWKLGISNVPQTFQSRIVDIDFTDVLNSDFQTSPTTMIYFGDNYDDGVLQLYVDTEGENVFHKGETISGTIDNIVSTLQAFYAARNGTGLVRTVERIGSVVRVNLCDQSSTYFRPAQDGLNVYVSGFALHSPTVTNYQEYMRGFLDEPSDNTIFYYSIGSGAMTLHINEILQQYSGSAELKWGLYFPWSVEPFTQQVINILDDYFVITESNSNSVTFEEPIDPTTYNILSLNDKPGFNICTLTELAQSTPQTEGDVNGLMLSELVALDESIAKINTSEIVGLICVEPVNAGDLVTPTADGRVRKVSSQELHDVIETSFLFTVLTSGTNVKARLINVGLYAAFVNVSSSSSNYSGYSSPSEQYTNVTWFLNLLSPTTDSYIEFYDGIGSYPHCEIDSDTTGYLYGTLTPSYWALVVNTNDGNRITVKDIFNTIDYTDTLDGSFKFLTNNDGDLMFTPDNGTNIYTLVYGFF